MDLIEKALRVMLLAHGQQVRKTDDSPYVIHPMMVAKKLARLGFGDEVIAATMVHDVLEDTDYSEKKLRQELGDKVVDIIMSLTENKSLEWETRKKKYIEAVKNAGPETKAISIADKIHNLESIIATHKKMGSKIWDKFNRGKEQKMWFENEMLKMFQATWESPMIAEYEKLLKEVEKLD
ncbi:MAG: HD domain-containing protein [Patescibacteria group bacterium]|jgi:(p)ppGpp synthase/HD superfamily hydrolase